MVDTDWYGTAEVRRRLGVSRQAIHKATARLEPLGLARRDAAGHWQLAAQAVATYQETQRWTRRVDRRRGVGADEPGPTVDALETLQMRVDLATAGEHSARLAERDAVIEALRADNQRLRRDVAALRAELAAVYQARAVALAGGDDVT